LIHAPAMPAEQPRQVLEQHVAEAIRRMQQHFFQDLRPIQQGDAAELVCGIERKNELVHWVSW